MSGSIFVIDGEGSLRRLHETKYEDEDVLQDLIARYPDLIPGDQVNPSVPRRWLLVSRELGVPSEENAGARWSLDHLFLDQDAVPTLVEVKRSSDSRIRRAVVGQMLDYAANSFLWSIERLQAAFVKTCEADLSDPGEVLGEFLGSHDPDFFWQAVKTNLQAGRIRLVFLADEIPPELVRIVEFLNEQMDPAEVLAVEVPRYMGDGLQTLSPRVVGMTAVAQRRKASGERLTRTWDTDTFLDALEENCGRAGREVGAQILAWSHDHFTRLWFGTGATNASFVPVLDLAGSAFAPFGVYLGGQVEIKFQYLINWPPFDSREKRANLLQRLNEIDGVDLPEDRLERRPSFMIEALSKPESLAAFLSTMEWCSDEFRAVAELSQETTG